MFPIKKLYLYLYKSYLPFLGMTTSVVLFIFVIQQIWQNIEKLVGKGLDTVIILEFLMYAILTLLPQVIPLAILLASLMIFGSLGEKMELLAIKASGVSLIKIMNPLIILVVAISLGSFYYQDKFVPVFNVKLQSLFRSIEQKNPDIAIPEGSFYNEFTGYSIYVKSKDKKTKTLHDVVIYDLSNGFKNIAVDRCDSAKITTSPRRDYQILTLYNGERFSNVKKEQSSNLSNSPQSNVREKYNVKILNLPFNSELERIDESRYGETYIAKTLSQLKSSSDSMKLRLDSINDLDRITVASLPLLKDDRLQFKKNKLIQEATDAGDEKLADINSLDTENTLYGYDPNKDAEFYKGIEIPSYAKDVDSTFNKLSVRDQMKVVNLALNESRNSQLNNLMFNHIDNPKHFLQRNIRMHEIKWFEVFKYSISCIIFFFIGASLGAIIGKGGLGVPVIISVFLYIFYHIINNVGYKLARDAIWEVWEGMLFSIAILAPIAIFFTYKSMRESALFNTEAYNQIFRNTFRIKSDSTRREMREPLYDEIPNIEDIEEHAEIIRSLENYDNKALKDIILNHDIYYDRQVAKYYQIVALSLLKKRNVFLFDVRVNNYEYEYSKKIVSWIKSTSLNQCLTTFCAFLICWLISIIQNSSVFSILSILFAFLYLISLQKTIIYIADFARSLNQKKNNIFAYISFLIIPKLNKASGLWIGLIITIFYPISMFLLFRKLDRKVDQIKDKTF